MSYSVHKGVCLVTDIEDLTTAIDVQDIYSKVRCKVGSVNILHRQRAYVTNFLLHIATIRFVIQ